MIPQPPPRLNEESVLLAFSIEPKHDRATLERYLKEYPEHADVLVELSLELWVDEARSNSDGTAIAASESLADQAWQKFQAVVAESNVISASNPFAALDSAAFKALAKSLDVNNLLLTRLRDRAIDSTTIPLRFVRELATALGAHADNVISYLQSPPAMVSEHSFRSDGKPEIGSQMSFAAAIAASQLSPEQQDKLKKLME